MGVVDDCSSGKNDSKHAEKSLFFSESGGLPDPSVSRHPHSRNGVLGVKKRLWASNRRVVLRRLWPRGVVIRDRGNVNDDWMKEV